MKPRISLMCMTFVVTLILIIVNTRLTASLPAIYGVLPSAFDSISDDGVATLQSNQPVQLTIFGTDVDQITHVGFAATKKPPGSPCEHDRVTQSFIVTPESSYAATTIVTLRELSHGELAFYLCVRLTSADQSLASTPSSSNSSESSDEWFFAGSKVSEKRISFRTTSKLMPVWLQIILIIVFFLLSGLFSGLNLGLMSLDKTELKIIESAGSPKEKGYAKAIRPVREKGNLLLCTLLLGNVLVNTSLTILMDDLTGSGLLAVVGSTIGITLFGEIAPQAICSRHGLAVGAKTLWLTKFFMLLTFPAAFPISFLLDKILGEEMGQVYSREKLGVLIREQAVAGTVATDEMNIITGALAITTKTVADVMTPLSDAFMLSYSDALDFTTLNDIYSHGYTRIPVYENDRRNIRAVLNVKDLAFINPEDRVPVSTVCDFYNRSIIIVLDSTNLEAMLKEFRQGRAHMAFVERLVTEGEGDPYREMIGLLTLEDVIEEIIQAEIVDETDILTDNVHHQPRHLRKRDFRMFSMGEKNHHSRLSPQLKIAALRHMASNIDEFSDRYVSYSVLQSFLNANIVGECIYNPKDDDANILYRPNQWANYAILLLQGRCTVEIGNEGLLFEAGPFVLFGETVLKRVNTIFPDLTENMDPSVQSARLAAEARFVPDYLVKACTNIQYLRITAEHYLLARRLTVLHQRAASLANSRTSVSASETGSSGKKVGNQTGVALTPYLTGSHDMFQTAWEHHIDRLRKAAVASAMAPLKQQGKYEDSPTSSVTDSPADSSEATVVHVPLARADVISETVIQKRNVSFLPQTGDVTSSKIDEIEAFIPHTTSPNSVPSELTTNIKA